MVMRTHRARNRIVYIVSLSGDELREIVAAHLRAADEMVATEFIINLELNGTTSGHLIQLKNGSVWYQDAEGRLSRLEPRGDE